MSYLLHRFRIISCDCYTYDMPISFKTWPTSDHGTRICSALPSFNHTWINHQAPFPNLSGSGDEGATPVGGVLCLPLAFNPPTPLIFSNSDRWATNQYFGPGEGSLYHGAHCPSMPLDKTLPTLRAFGKPGEILLPNYLKMMLSPP